MTKHLKQVGLGIALLLFLSVAAFAEKEYVQFREGFNDLFGISAAGRSAGPQILAFSATKGLPPNAAYLDARAMKAIGGVLFLQVAKPKSAANICPTVRVDINETDGKRLAVRFSSSNEVHGDIFDWEIIPTAEYVASGQDGLFSYMGVEAEYQTAFADNLAGLNLFLVDNARVLRAPFPYAHLFMAAPSVAGYPQSQPTEANLAAWSTLKAFLTGNQLMFWDRDVDFIFSAQGDRLIISGEPYWVAVEKMGAAGTGQVIRSFQDTAGARLSNPIIYDSVYRISKYAAFFKYLARSCGKNWMNFQADLAANRAKMKEIVVHKHEMWTKYGN